MTVLDAQALLAHLLDEPAADDVAILLRRLCVLSAVNAAEVVDQLVRVRGRDADAVHADLALLSVAGLEVRAVTGELGIAAGRLRARRYHRTRQPVSLADCTAAVTALSLRRPLATADAPLAAVVRSEGGVVHALPDSRGRRP